MREWLSGRASPCQGECREFESRFPLHFFLFSKRYHGQVVRQRSAKPLFPGSNPGGTSKKKSRARDFFFLYFSLFSFHSSLFLNFSTRLFQRRDKKEERKEKEAFLLPLKSIKLYLGSNPSIKKVKYLFLSKQQFFK